ncbi:MAG: U32 family peptidase [[Eubacterium] sulci]|nr:U32 family peptidase [[Eubacterium] sulci]MBF1182168.1 U32 family peptidase [[Eubacterium] sulci]MBF1185513.1 U32 family peptidase [[Eubacterium] sulci]
MQRIELLAPAGDLEKLKIAIEYGADAVYFGGQMFSLRAGAGGFTKEDMIEGLEFAHERGKKCYMTLNIFAHNEDIKPLTEYLHSIKELPIDAFLISDPGIMALIKDIIPNAEIHLSTQANMTNYATANFWYNMGLKRLVLARELSLVEIEELMKNIPEDLEIEAFVHGAMCISYSGRCLLSNFMADRDSNRGRCAHPCRWKYALQEEKRPGEYYPIEEDERGTYIMNSKDLCMIEHIEDLAKSNIASAKIEGRNKSIFYLAIVIGAYRRAIDAYYEGRYDDAEKEQCLIELSKASHREFTTGFYYEKADEDAQNYKSSSYVREYSFVGMIKGYDEETSMAIVEQRNKMLIGDTVEIFGPDCRAFEQIITEMYDLETGEALKSAPHPQQMLKIKVDRPVKVNYMMRKETK